MIAVVASLVIGGMFGTATASVESNDGDVMVVDIEVEVSGDPATVVAHLTWDEHELILPLLERGGNVFGIRTELEPRNYVVVFEAIGEQTESSEPVTLSRLGAELGPEPGTGGEEPDEQLSPESRRLLWLAVALGAASLSVLAFWVLGGRDEGDDVVVVEDGET